MAMMTFDRDGFDDGYDATESSDAPICRSCGVTAMPAERPAQGEGGFVCENPDCAIEGEPVE